MNVSDAIAGSFSGIEPELDLKPGDHVRSYDFAGNRESYVDGVIESVTPPMEGCPRYKILSNSRVFGGKPIPVPAHEEYVYPPVNGTPTLMGALTNFVVRLPLSS